MREDRYLDVIGQPDRAAALRRCAELVGGVSGFSIAWTAEPCGPQGRTAGPCDAPSLVVRQVSGVRTDLMNGLAVPVGHGLTGKVYGSARPDWVDDYFGADSITHDFDREMAGEGVRRLLAVPITLGGRTFGVLAAGSRDDGEFGDVALDEALDAARAAAVAIDIAERVEQRIVRLQDTIGSKLASISASVRDLAADPATAPVLRPRLGLIADQAGAATGALRELRAAVAPVLTGREQEVLSRMAAGLTNPEIADGLGISRHTVKDYVEQVLRKLGARNRVQAVARGRELGLL